ncbi:hypothetical protein C0J52_14698 [Blattella germanica]|nr:hypothetical protein C0J52_14698 [Blattella germanica]
MVTGVMRNPKPPFTIECCVFHVTSGRLNMTSCCLQQISLVITWWNSMNSIKDPLNLRHVSIFRDCT